MIPMNNCSQAPQALSVRAAAERYLDSWRDDVMDWEPWIEEVERARTEFALLINADPGDVAVCSSVSHATASVAGALDYAGRRDSVVVSQAEFPTVGQVWQAHQRLGAMPVQVLGEDIRRVLTAKDFSELEGAVADPLLDPQELRRDMPELAEASPAAYPDGRGAVRPHAQWQAHAEVLQQRPVSKADARGLHAAVELRLHRRIGRRESESTTRTL